MGWYAAIGADRPSGMKVLRVEMQRVSQAVGQRGWRGAVVGFVGRHGPQSRRAGGGRWSRMILPADFDRSLTGRAAGRLIL